MNIRDGFWQTLIWSRWRKKLSQRKQHQQDVQRKLANTTLKYLLKKAAVIVCFFLLLPGRTLAVDNTWQFDPQLERIYKLVLNLDTDQAYAELAKLKSVNELHKLYVQSLLETTDILITEDDKRFEKVNDIFKERIDR